MPYIEWIEKRERMPEKADEDRYGTILVFDVNSGTRLSNAAFVRTHGSQITHWAHMPEEPKREAQ